VHLCRRSASAAIAPEAIAITPDGKTAYVANNDLAARHGGTVTPIRLATNTALAPIKVGFPPRPSPLPLANSARGMRQPQGKLEGLVGLRL
jgi:DNA-binding beta-propeller fold protein YncE